MNAAVLQHLPNPGEYQPQSETEAKIIAALRTVFDPEIPVNIYDLGLIYKIDIGEGGHVKIDMTLTAPGCPVAGEMPGMVAVAAETVEEVKEATVNLVWEPAWTKDRMSEDARLALGFF
ncbi:MAG: SUF system Fe-S cluster assembly protein [Bdellovibrionales bacterium]